MVLTSFAGPRTFAQDSVFNANPILKAELTVMQDSEYQNTGYEKGIFLSNPLMLSGKPLDYGKFNLESKGQLTVCKGAKTPAGQTKPIPFYVYLRRNGNKILIPAKEKSDPKQVKIDLSEIFKYAKPGDHLVIEAVNKEDGRVKRILKLLGGGC